MSRDLTEAVRLLQAGELVAFPTETVYGLGADAANPEAVAKVFAAKGRPADHPLIVHLPGAGHLDRWARDIPQAAWDLAEAFWPGPLTLILKRADAVPLAVTGGQDTVGVRVPAHPLALDLLRAYAQAGGGRDGMCGIAGPSANRFGRISPTDAEHVREELGTAVALVLDGGPCQVGIESTIVDLSRDDAVPRILRPGHITPERIAAVIGVTPDFPAGRPAGAVPRVSGSLDAHYAPRTALRVVASADLAVVLAELAAQGKRVGVLARTESGAAESAAGCCRLPDDPEAYARGFYAGLRELDQGGNDLIVVEALGVGPDWAAVADRLRRAACGAGEG
ncbi:L-threonylcarbamoyladenylate synthase [Propionivibrio dicarboxylicus]|uniref:Threonylcarbamoyl-AMP synthase n=1 Tax=Propionivibrio dicarboxylicus TaxID=83767 RepID=A0A1G8NES5_9RHOO|nr:L-threonylcarbamoyladenylate synthase [Propionivibrio dicarboxylicus]SDI78020.1 L-threonylcarbamoyladenylate synthase [Propionivibrio dicarboxylicus]